jgi:hypothetical protein
VVPSPEEQSALGDYQRFVDGKVGMMGIGPWNSVTVTSVWSALSQSAPLDHTADSTENGVEP